MTNTRVVEDVSSDTDGSSDEGCRQTARISAKEMTRLSKEKDEMNHELTERDEIIELGTAKVTPTRKYYQTARVASNSPPPFAGRVNELNNEVVLLASRMNTLEDELSEAKKK